MTTQIVTLIGVIVSGIVSLVTCTITQNKTHSLFMYRVEQLEKKVDLHNDVIKRTFLLEQKVDIIEHILEKIDDKIEA